MVARAARRGVHDAPCRKPRVGRPYPRDPSRGELIFLGQRVRDLADRMRHAITVITDGDAGRSARVVGYLALLEKIFDVHDPSVVLTAAERTWRLWVRLEVVQVLVHATTGRKGGGHKVRKLRGEL